jgi:hypothetical protein
MQLAVAVVSQQLLAWADARVQGHQQWIQLACVNGTMLAWGGQQHFAQGWFTKLRSSHFIGLLICSLCAATFRHLNTQLCLSTFIQAFKQCLLLLLLLPPPLLLLLLRRLLRSCRTMRA